MLEHVDIVLSFAIVMLLLSLLVTTFVQIVVAVLALRSQVLKLGIRRLLRQVSPDLTQHARKIARAVVRHPAVATGRSTTDIKKEELIQLLDDLAKDSNKSLKDDVKNALKKVMGNAPAQELKAIADLAYKVTAEMEKAFPEDVANIKRIVERTIVPTRQIVVDVTTWFNTVIDRTTDVFRTLTRWITVGFAVLLPFLLHIDSLAMFRQLTSDSQLRAKLMQNMGATMDRAAEVFSLGDRSMSLASAALELTCKDKPEIASAHAIKNIPSGLAKCSEGDAWLGVTFRECKDPNAPKMFSDAYHKQFEKLAAANLQGILQCTNEIKASLDESGLKIFAISNSWPDIGRYRKEKMHFWGTLMTAVFLSLGAPFWYNVLKQLSNLRPAIAQKIDLASQPRE